jgi:hypothetical protein
MLTEFLENRQDGQPYAPAAFTPEETPVVLVYVRGLVDPRALVCRERLSK